MLFKKLFWQRKRIAVKKIFLALIGLLLIFAAVAFLAVFYLARDLPTIEEISARRISQSTKIYDRTGTVLLYEISNDKERTLVTLGEISKYLQNATVAVEDENFYNEPAFDWQAILRALVVDVLRGHVVQGGSTITQQLAKNAFLTDEKTISRKIKELILATKLNERYSKDKVLELYLNEIPYGPTFYGVEAASEAYFGKPVKDLNLAESAIIAALPKAPSYYSPWGSHQKELIGRERFILKKMLDSGRITKKEFDAASAFKPVFTAQGRGIKAPHFVMAVQDYLLQKYGEDMVREGGLKVITTLDWSLEQAAEKAIADGAAQNEKLYNGKNAALVAEDSKTGQIRALVGSRDYFDAENEGNFDVATQGLRQPGSALKPFVYLTAFQKGYTPDTVVFDVPTEFTANDPNCPQPPDFQNDNKECFHPQNFDNQFRGPVSLRNALAQSINVPAVKVLYLAGLNDSVKNAYNFGLTTLTSPNLYGLSLVLGGGAVRLIDLAGAYAVLADDGIKHAQSMVLQVAGPDGQTLESYKDQNSRVADTEPVRLINNILSDPDARSGLFQNSLSLTVFSGYDVALKTGTSDDYRDAWSVGYTPQLVVGVWAGNNDNSPMQRHGSSILAAVPIWYEFMSEAVKTLQPETFNKPEPQYPQKPILAGDYARNKQLHSILYYVDRSDPTGPPRQNPANDPQFANWEAAVLDWAKNNLPDFADYNKPVVPGTENTRDGRFTPPHVTLKEPTVGSFIGSQVNVSAKIESSNPLRFLEIYFNGELKEKVSFNPGTVSYDFRWLFFPSNANPQNLLEVIATDQNNLSGKAEAILYK